MKGAEAVVSETEVIGIPAVLKKRIVKSYRVKGLDEKLRRERTRSEARLLHKAKLAGVKCPVVLQIDDFDIYMSFIEGERPSMNENECKIAGELLASLHQADIIHGDYTPANLIKNKEGIHVIDFGLGFVSKKAEDKAVDILLLKRAVFSKHPSIAKKCFDAVTKGYRNKEVLERLKLVESRGRYKKKT